MWKVHGQATIQWCCKEGLKSPLKLFIYVYTVLLAYEWEKNLNCEKTDFELNALNSLASKISPFLPSAFIITLVLICFN